MFLGEFEHTLDNKNRVILPSRFRAEFQPGGVLTRGLDGCIAAYTKITFASFSARIGSLDAFSEEARRLQRYFFSDANPCLPDSQGRVTLPVGLLRHATIDKYIVIAGIYDHLEIWDQKTWTTTVGDGDSSTIEEIAERLASRPDENTSHHE